MNINHPDVARSAVYISYAYSARSLALLQNGSQIWKYAIRISRISQICQTGVLTQQAGNQSIESQASWSEVSKNTALCNADEGLRKHPTQQRNNHQEREQTRRDQQNSSRSQ